MASIDNQKSDSLQSSFPIISEVSKAQLSSDFREEEILNAIMSMSLFKAPGPDGYQAVFYQQTWSVTGPVIISLVKKILGGEKIPKGVAEALLVLIPKIEEPCGISQFRPN